MYNFQWLFSENPFENHSLRLPDEYGHEYDEEQLAVNLFRELWLVRLLLFVNLILLWTDLVQFRHLWQLIPAYYRLFQAHIVMILVMPVFLLLYGYAKKSRDNVSLRTGIHIGINLFILLWCAFLSVNAQGIHEQISAYILGVFTVTSLIIMRPGVSFALLFSSYVVFVAGLLLSQNNPEKLSGNIINASFLLLLAFSVSILNYMKSVHNFVSSKHILMRTQELDEAHRNLELLVQDRSKELVKTGSKLMEEMKAKHQMEMEMARTRFLYEEKEQLLNKTLEYEKLRINFFANISHELRTPLNVIFSAHQMLNLSLDKKDVIPDELKKYSHIIRQNCYRLIRLVSNLIDITKIDAGYYEINLQNHNIVQIVEDITLSVAEYAKSKSMELVFDTELEEMMIACDPDKIERIMLNLLSNALKYTPPNGNILVGVCRKDGYAVISVKDSGRGIPQDKQEMIFERFVQANNSTTRDMEGSGIGLSLVKSLVELHRGRVYLKSKYGHGCEFVVELPEITYEGETAVVKCRRNEHIERINIEFADIYT
jgi:two-component system, OmpR family, phosphate regulon sensor histidine kinase PhoR